MHTFVDLGSTPLANSFVTAEQLGEPEPGYPLHARVCAECMLVQLDEVVPPDQIFSDYAYFSSYSDSWVAHAGRFAHMATERFGLGPESMVVEVGSNDGYLLRHFVGAGVNVLGLDPAANVAATAQASGVPTKVCFFGRETAEKLRAEGLVADLVVGNNVVAHVPDLNDFVSGFASILSSDGVLSLEFPHILRLLEGVQFDTIYHEHFSYFSLLSLERVLAEHGLRIFDVQELPTHGGSLRVLACLAQSSRGELASVAGLRAQESAAGLDRLETYQGFADKVELSRQSLRHFLDAARLEGRSVVAYGAAAKGNTLLNTVPVGVDDIAYVVDRSPEKQGRFLPGSHLPIRSPDHVRLTKPDFLLVLPWNLVHEIADQMCDVREWGCRFAVPIPTLEILE